MFRGVRISLLNIHILSVSVHMFSLDICILSYLFKKRKSYRLLPITSTVHLHRQMQELSGKSKNWQLNK